MELDRTASRITSLSARRAWIEIPAGCWRDARRAVALRKESVDRNLVLAGSLTTLGGVALRKESVDRNISALASYSIIVKSLSARRAWIEIRCPCCAVWLLASLSARRAWIEIVLPGLAKRLKTRRSPQGERG